MKIYICRFADILHSTICRTHVRYGVGKKINIYKMMRFLKNPCKKSPEAEVKHVPAVTVNKNCSFIRNPVVWK